MHAQVCFRKLNAKPMNASGRTPAKVTDAMIAALRHRRPVVSQRRDAGLLQTLVSRAASKPRPIRAWQKGVGGTIAKAVHGAHHRRPTALDSLAVVFIQKRQVVPVAQRFHRTSALNTKAAP